MINNYDTACFALRLGIAFLYIYAAFMNSKDKISLQWTIDNTRPLFRNTSFEKNEQVIRVFAYCGIAIMYIGGASVLFGIEARLGAILLLAFTIGGTIIHNRQRLDARKLALNNSSNPVLSGIAWSAFAAHFANILKNICLFLILLFIFFCGVGKHTITDIIGKSLLNI